MREKREENPLIQVCSGMAEIDRLAPMTQADWDYSLSPRKNQMMNLMTMIQWRKGRCISGRTPNVTQAGKAALPSVIFDGHSVINILSHNNERGEIASHLMPFRYPLTVPPPSSGGG